MTLMLAALALMLDGPSEAAQIGGYAIVDGKPDTARLLEVEASNE